MTKFRIVFLVALLAVMMMFLFPKTAHEQGQEQSRSEPQIGEGISIEAPKDIRPDLIDAFFLKKKMPLSGYGSKFVSEADKAGIDWRLLAAISVKESSGGLRYPKKTFNPFGWNSAKSGFKSIDQAIEFISDKLGHGRYYAGKTTLKKLQAYNPPSISPNYAPSVIGIMKQISPVDNPVEK